MNAQQRSDEWFESRLGIPTSSMYSAVLAKGEGKTRAAYMLKLAAERLTGKRAESFSNGHTDRGEVQETFAQMAYEARTGNVVQEVGFIRHSVLLTGGSPDGLIDFDRGLEIKSVIPTVQIETIRKGGYPTGHKAQIQGNLFNTGRAWWDFCSFSPDMPEGLDLYIFRVERDEDYIKNMEAEIIRFNKELDAMMEALNSLKVAA